MVKKINLLNVDSPIHIDCDLSSKVTEIGTPIVAIASLEESVNNHISYMSNTLNEGMENIFAQLVVRREYLEHLLTNDSPAFRFYIGTKNQNPTPDDYKFILVPVDNNKVDLLNDEIIVIECEKPPGCTNNVSGASLIRDEFRTIMHSAELGRNQSLS